ncbi:DNA repair protein RecO [Austwickia sp. TVS 96-490-7B]|uniref:DNA repair protein RecO n=1 Tax=Austwickia sp. TVS 96-490-7B TaxID=2830843 RepID=UPI001C5A11B4|nr:DNA repair protein RecO [Austwickia sp. TVS 96-490-7B]
MPVYRDAAVVLRTHDLAEADRIVTVLTPHRGQIRVVAKGVRRTSSRFGARLEPAMVVDLQCREGRSLDTVTQAEMIAPYGDAIARDYTSWTACHAMLETAQRLTGEQDPSPHHFRLLTGALASLAAARHDPALVLDAYLLRALAVAGWAPSFRDCVRCGATGPHRAFHIASGGCVCPSCRLPGATAPSSASLVLAGALLEGDWVTADGSSAAARRETSGMVAAFLQWHLERGVRSLRWVERGTHPSVSAPPDAPADLDVEHHRGSWRRAVGDAH